MTTREELYRLIDELPESELNDAEKLLRYLSTHDPMVIAHLTAPSDDEPSTDEEDESADEAWNEYLQGKALTADEAKRLLLP